MAALALCGLAALAGCAASAGGPFRLNADQITGAWAAVMAREEREAHAQGIDPLWDPQPPRFSDAKCTWIEPARKALCRYRVSRGMTRPGSERRWFDEEAELYLTEAGWDFGY